MEDKEKEQELFVEELKTQNDPIEEWPIKKLKKEAEDDGGQGQQQVRDDLGIE